MLRSNDRNLEVLMIVLVGLCVRACVHA